MLTSQEETGKLNKDNGINPTELDRGLQEASLHPQTESTGPSSPPPLAAHCWDPLPTTLPWEVWPYLRAPGT